MNKTDLSRRTFIRKTIGAAGAILAVTPALLATNLDADQTASSKQSASAGECSVNRLEEASKGYKPRYPGPRWHLIYGSYTGVEAFALDELQAMVQRYLPYVVQVRHAAEPLDPDAHHVLLGTVANNPRLAELGEKGSFKVPTKAQGYSSACFKSPWNADRKAVVIAGADPAAVSYGVMDFNKRLAGVTPDDPKDMRHALDDFSEFSAQEVPVIENRGLWSWGYVIYDYRRYIDNMARLRMNRLIFWNDVPPVNCQEIINYAHSRAIEVVLGFSWGYDLATLDPASAADRQVVKDSVLCQIAEYYQHLGMDAIYFQCFTETDNKAIGGQRIAVLARNWVNNIAAAVWEKYPEMKLEWGVHASSIAENYKDLERLDPRIVIVWEDAGVIPYSYDPVTRVDDAGFPSQFNSPSATREYSKKLVALRGHSPFAMVAKGWIQMRWRTESEHHGPFIMGKRAANYIRNRSRERQPRWDFVNNLWLKNYPEALRFFAEVRNASPAPMTVTGLVDDGLFEEKIQSSVALFAEMLWNPTRDAEDILQEAENPYYAQIA